MLNVLFFITAGFCALELLTLAVSDSARENLYLESNGHDLAVTGAIVIVIAMAVLCFVATHVGGTFAFVYGIILASFFGLTMISNLMAGKWQFLTTGAMCVLFIVSLV